MYTLLLDSSNRNLSVAIAKDGNILASVQYDAWQRQSELLVQEISNLLKELNLSINSINGIGVAVGPGSYTGVRIAVTIAKVFGYAKQIPVYQMSSLAVLRHKNLPTVCVINARSGRSYVGIYEGVNIISTDKVITNEEVLELLEINPNYVIAGDTAYLQVESVSYNRFENMISMLTLQNKVNDIASLKARYIKD